MSTIEEFENAPVGATARRPDGRCAIKTARADWPWDTTEVSKCTSRYMVSAGYTLDPSMPTTSREALDLAWELAHPVKKGQSVPVGTELLYNEDEGIKESIMTVRLTATHDWADVRTLDPLPDSEPDWLDAPAVMALVMGRVGDPQVFARENKTGTQWLCDTKVYHWTELIGVTPLYPKEGKES